MDTPSAGAANKLRQYQFADRWRITGTLTTRSPVHIGSGETTERDGLVNEGESKPCEVQAVVLDWQGRPCIPGSAIKGVLRSWAAAFLPQHIDSINRLFGDPDFESVKAESGRAEFLTAPVIWEDLPAGWMGFTPYPDERRLTGVMSRVCINRAARVAEPDHLFYEEYVPPGVKFRVEILGSGFRDVDVGFLLALLEKGATHPVRPFQFGANGNSEWGRLDWAPEKVTRVPRNTISLQAITGSAFPENFEVHENASAADLTLEEIPQLVLDLTLEFQGPFLVNDPFRTKTKGAPKSSALPNHAPMRTYDGRVLLPSSSFRGAFRSRAEKIVRTFNKDEAGVLGEATPDEKDPGLIAELFGDAKRGSVVEISDFIAEGERCHLQQRQEFVAIDRFTGGSARHLKFNAEYVDSPTLRGRVAVDLARVKPCGLGLLVLTFRDLIEGDVTFGFGASKGYGACRAKIRGVRLGGRLAANGYRELLNESGIRAEDINGIDPTKDELPEAIALLFLELAQALHARLKSTSSK